MIKLLLNRPQRLSLLLASCLPQRNRSRSYKPWLLCNFSANMGVKRKAREMLPKPNNAAAAPDPQLISKATQVAQQLAEFYPNPAIPLNHATPYQLLVAVILSAQVQKIEQHIRVLGLAPTKAKNILAMSQVLVEKFDGQVPSSFQELEELPGVGHKTASVIMAQVFRQVAFPVDTHIHRLAQRWGFTNGRNVEQTERDLKALFPEESWHDLHLQIIYFGREHCPAQRHDPTACPICCWAAVPPYDRAGLSPLRPGQSPAQARRTSERAADDDSDAPGAGTPRKRAASRGPKTVVNDSSEAPEAGTPRKRAAGRSAKATMNAMEVQDTTPGKGRPGRAAKLAEDPDAATDEGAGPGTRRKGGASRASPGAAGEAAGGAHGKSGTRTPRKRGAAAQATKQKAGSTAAQATKGMADSVVVGAPLSAAKRRRGAAAAAILAPARDKAAAGVMAPGRRARAAEPAGAEVDLPAAVRGRKRASGGAGGVVGSVKPGREPRASTARPAVGPGDLASSAGHPLMFIRFSYAGGAEALAGDGATVAAGPSVGGQDFQTPEKKRSTARRRASAVEAEPQRE